MIEIPPRPRILAAWRTMLSPTGRLLLIARSPFYSPVVYDLLPGIAGTFRRRIECLTAALDRPNDAHEAIRQIIDRIAILLGPTLRGFSFTLQGELGTIFDWIERTGQARLQARR